MAVGREELMGAHWDTSARSLIPAPMPSPAAEGREAAP